MNKRKILNDPIYGFVAIPDALTYDLVRHRYFQRLRRISQMGLSYLVFPGAMHTRFHHALGAMHLMQQAVETLRIKGVTISADEESALYAAILLHDIGHGPFSHALEHSIVENVGHESVSMLFMDRMNTEMRGRLSLAISIFKGDYRRKFMHQLISSQLDMDRMDYLRRDSFYTGVAEGNINSDRLIQMMNVTDDVLVMEEKGIYSIEKFLMARRLMYWQAYLHKTSLGAELILVKVLKRARELLASDVQLAASDALLYFMGTRIGPEDFNDETLERFSQLDDYDVVGALKSWQFHQDFILSSLCKMLINRELPKIRLSSEKFSSEKVQNLIDQFTSQQNISRADASYFIFKGKIKNQAYSKTAGPIHILKKDGTLEDVAETEDQLSLKALSKPVTRYYLCYPKQLVEN